jgi:2-ketocyclohexanecarboxyl-CoA hydrolase
MTYEDILHDKRDGIATITINRPAVLNAFRARTVEEMLDAVRDADNDGEIGVVVLAGAGERAFCSGGDNSSRASSSEKDGGYGGRGLVGMPIEELHSAIRDCRKPVIAKVQGYAIGGGNVLATVCDLTIASDKAVFGQVGPRVGSVDPGWGTAYLSRLVGEKRARDLVSVPPLHRRRGLPDGPRQQGRAGRRARRRGRKLVPRDHGAEPDRDRHRQAFVQCR